MITDTGVAVPEDMAAALEADQEALEVFRGLRPGDQREFVTWLGRHGTTSRADRLAEITGRIRNFHHRENPPE